MDRVKNVANVLKTKGVVNKLRQVENDINQYLSPCFDSLEGKDYLHVLRRWNSYTPALRTEDETSLGGGYFLSWHGKGLVIDPGFDFIKNFHNAGFSIGCIHAVAITHSHLDHYTNLEPIITLMFEYNDQRKRDAKNGKKDDWVGLKHFHLLSNLGMLKACSGWLDYTHKAKQQFSPLARIYPLDSYIGEAIHIPDTDIRIRPTYAEHNEIIAVGYSVGLIVELLSKDKLHVEASIGFTADTAWTQEVHEQYNNVDMLVTHIGTVNEDELMTLVPYSKHLGAIGTTKLLCEQRQKCKLYVISEFGEEFRQSRRDIITTIKQVLDNPQQCIVGDIGTKIKLPDMSLSCEFTNCNNRAEPVDNYDYYGIVKHYCKDHIPYKARWGQFEL